MVRPRSIEHKSSFCEYIAFIVWYIFRAWIGRVEHIWEYTVDSYDVIDEAITSLA